jgi:hypothetical protein
VAGLALVSPLAWPALAGFAGPLLLVLPERGAPLDAAAARAGLPAGLARVEIIPGADPGFQAGLPLAGRAVAGWLAGCR